jgi:hypothetical protein
MKRSSSLAVALAAALGLPTCHAAGSGFLRADADRRRIVATVGREVITVGDVENRLQALSPLARARYAAPDKRRELVEDMIRVDVLANEARERGYDRDPEVVRLMKQPLIAKLIERDFDAKRSTGDISDAEVQDYYASHPYEFTIPGSGQLRPKDEVKDQIRQRLLRDGRASALDAYVANLEKKTRIEVREAALKPISADSVHEGGEAK